jgi:glycosyltransferase involved in cell wall biosynthesis
MKIAQVSPLYESVPPQCYGGTERVVAYLTEALIDLGHEVTLFASGDSLTRARLVASCPKSLRTDPTCTDPHVPHLLMLEEVQRRAHEFDLLHFHVDYQHFPLSRRCPVPHLTTLHGRLDLPELVPLYQEFVDMPLVSISGAQRRPLPFANWAGTVHHGLPMDLYPFRPLPGDYLAFLGRISPEKRVDRAIAIAQTCGLPLKIAAKIDATDREYFDESIRPLLATPGVEFIGEIGEEDKGRFLGQALAVLFPIDWEEPFGLVMIESLACGTPVVAFRRGSVPEVLTDGITGYVVEDIEEAVLAVGKIGAVDRRTCRAAFEERFSASRMAADYLAIYQRLAKPSAQATRLLAN